MTPTSDIPLPRLLSVVKSKVSPGSNLPRYRQVVDLVRDGVIPTVMVGRCHFVRQADLPAVMTALRLSPVGASEQAAA